MPNRLVLDGDDDLIAALNALPSSLQDRAVPILRRHAEQAASAIRAEYPVVTGDLRDGVIVEERPPYTPLTARVYLASMSEHARYYEFGTYRTRPHAVF